jgi:hypothetical protein
MNGLNLLSGPVEEKSAAPRRAHPPGGQVPLGYRAVREPHAGRWQIEPEEAALVHRIFALCIGGMTMRGIARQLTAEGLPTESDRDEADAKPRGQACGASGASFTP